MLNIFGNVANGQNVLAMALFYAHLNPRDKVNPVTSFTTIAVLAHGSFFFFPEPMRFFKRRSCWRRLHKMAKRTNTRVDIHL